MLPKDLHPRNVEHAYLDAICKGEVKLEIPVYTKTEAYLREIMINSGSGSSIQEYKGEITKLQYDISEQEKIVNDNLLTTVELYERLEHDSTFSIKSGKIIEIYAILVIKNLKTIDEVPYNLKTQVEQLIKEV